MLFWLTNSEAPSQQDPKNFRTESHSCKGLDHQSAGCWAALASDLLASAIVKTIRGYKLATQIVDTRYDFFGSYWQADEWSGALPEGIPEDELHRGTAA